MRNERVPRPLKVGTAIAALLIVSPLNLLGDIPILGLIDDAALLALLATLFVNLATKTLPQRQEPPMRVVTPITVPGSPK
jgi:uncharacterized membrane protein YkvA (DUF1232 family)